MGNINIEPGSVLHGILHSDFDNFLIYRYAELLRVFEELFKNNGADQNRRFTEFYINSINNHVADLEHIIFDLTINVENEVVQKGFISASSIKLNNLQTIVAKCNCLKVDLKMMSDNMIDRSKKKKTYASEVRAKAFYLVMMQRDGKISSSDMESRDRIIEIASKEFPGGVKTAGRQVYNMLREDGIWLQFLDEKMRQFEPDYTYGQELYRIKYPDT